LSTIQSRGRAPLWASTIATVAGLGKLRPGPGTWGSALAVLTWFLISQVISPELQCGALILLSLAVIAIGIPAATKVASAYGNKDPQNVIIDEVAGQWITLIAVPVAWKSLLVGFILFRGFDIFKPPPIRRIETLPGGFGIVLDDVAAGIYASIMMHLLLYLGWL
jgi:phosphatidylglycerophosphatase A